MTQEPDEINTHNNPESRVAEESASQIGSRSSAGGPIYSGARQAGAVPGVPDPSEGDPNAGTAGGNPVEGITIDPADAEQAVRGDEGPEHPGAR